VLLWTGWGEGLARQTCGAVAQGAGCKAVGRSVGHHQSPLPPRGLCLYGVMAAADVLA
jgi:hypothetical protein